jgi:RNAse (barnase) inhibitor barstar
MSNVKNVSADYYSADGERLVFIDGNTCDTIDRCYATLAQQLSLPDYFGYNLDALEEALADADWITEKRVHIVILNKGDLLKNDPTKKHDFLDIITSNDNPRFHVTILDGD